MKLNKMKLTNFQSFKEFIFEPKGQNCSVYGDNGTGKTTIYNAMCWLLFDKPSNEEKSWSPKTYDNNGHEIPKLEHGVFAEFELENGETITFEKILTEKWVTKRGSKDHKFEGNTVSYYINAVPVAKGEFDNRIQQCLYDPSVMQIVSKPFYFAQDMHWEERRNLLLEMCGDVSAETVIESNLNELADIKEFLKNGSGMYTVDELLKIAKETIKRTKSDLEMIPVQINEAVKARPDVDCNSLDKTLNEIESLEKDLEKVYSEKAAYTSSDEEQALKRAIADLEIARDMDEAAFKKKFNEDNQSINDDISFINKEMLEIQHSIDAITLDIYRKKAKFTDLSSMREKYSAQYKEIDSRKWSGDTICVTCGQALPSDQIQSAKDKFNTEKSRQLEKIIEDCKQCSKEILGNIQAEIARMEEDKKALEERFDEMRKKKEKLVANVPTMPVYATTVEGIAYAEKIVEAQRKLSDFQKNPITQVTLNALDNKINEDKEKISELKNLCAQIEQAIKQQKRIDEIAEREEELNDVLAKYEKAQYLCETFYKAKSTLLNSRINTRFISVQFKLFEEQINGGLKECCEVMIPCKTGLIPFGKANTASQINAGLEIIEVITSYYGKSIPVFIDNAESVINVRNIEPQVIKLIVKEGCDELKVITA